MLRSQAVKQIKELNVIKLSVVMLNVVAPFEEPVTDQKEVYSLPFCELT